MDLLTPLILAAFLVTLFCPNAVKRRDWYFRGWGVMIAWLILQWFISLFAGPRTMYGISIIAVVPLAALLMACYPHIDIACCEEKQVLDVLKKCKVIKDDDAPAEEE